MRIKNVSARLHHIGNLSLAPGQEGECPEGFEKSFNTNDIQEVKPAKPAKAPTAAELKAKAAAVQAAESKLASAKLGGDADAIAAAEAELAELAA